MLPNSPTAQRMLEGGRYRVSEVAYGLGFANPAHFSKRFKSFYRVPPSSFLPRHGGSDRPGSTGELDDRVN